MKMKSILFSLALALSAAPPAAQAAPVEVTYTASGSAGNWIYDFTFTNNTGNQYLYFMGASVNDSTPTLRPINFGSTTANWDENGVIFNNQWASNAFENGVNPSMSVSGFELTSTALTLQSVVNVFAYGYNYGVQYVANDYQTGNPTNPGFILVATRLDANDVPEPASLALLGAGLLGLGIARSKSKAATAA